MIKNIFFDRDGTLGYLGDIRDPESIVFFKDTKPVLTTLKAMGKRLFIASNQACIARGTSHNYDFKKEFDDLGFDDYFICPHDNNDNCKCRKPKSDLLVKAIEKYNLNIDECLMVGDRETDVICGHNINMKAVLINRVSSSIKTDADYMVYSLTELLELIKEL